MTDNGFMETKFFKKGTVIFREGDRSSEMYYIESGAIALMCDSNHDSKIPVNILLAGSLLGEFSFFDNLPRSATAMMLEDTRLLIIDEKVIRTIGKNGIFIIKALIDKLRKMNELIKNSEEAA